MFPALEFLHHLAALRLPNSLANHMLGRLSRDTTELLGLQRNIYHRADFCFFIIFVCVIEQNFSIRVLHRFHHSFTDCHLEFSFFRVNLHQPVFAPTIIAFDSNGNCRLDLFQQVISGNPFLFFQKGQRLEKFGVHHLSPPMSISSYKRTNAVSSIPTVISKSSSNSSVISPSS